MPSLEKHHCDRGSLKPQSYSICLNTEVTVRDNGHANNFNYDVKKMWPTSSVHLCLLGIHNYIIMLL